MRPTRLNAEPGITWRLLVLVALCLALSLAVAACSKEEREVPPKQSMPGIGKLNGVRMLIPAAYEFFPVEYEGDEIWTRPPKRHAPGPDVPIRSFSLLLHFPDFAPRTKENEASWLGRHGMAARANEWIDVDVKPSQGIGNDSARSFSWFIEQQMDGQIGWTRGKANWYFEREPGLIYGLVNEKKIGPDYSKIDIDNKEVFYDPLRSSTYIVCGTGAGGAKFCEQDFILPEVGALVGVHYAKSNLESWNLIQQNVRRIVLSFRF